MRMHLLLRHLLFILVLISSTANAITGPEVAQLLNTRYNNTAAICVGNNPAYYCNGVLVQAIPADHPLEFWKHGDTAIALGAEQVAYLRKDLSIRALSQKNGVVFADQFTAISQNKPLDVLCAYPFVAEIQSGRPGYGCGLIASASAPRQLEDPSSCAALGVNNAAGWLAYFQGQNNEPQRQCSLSSRQPEQFQASLEAHQLLDSEWSAKPNELLLKNWDPLTPANVPVQALFYDATQKGALLGAQRDQRDYFETTGEWLPVLRLALNDETHNVFGFNLQDQLYVGYQVESKLNARYADVSPSCPGGTAAYNCNGVLIRITDAVPEFHAWDPSDNSISRNGVSFSYLRADALMTRLAWHKTQGFIVKELAAPAAHPLTLRCSFPYDGSTTARPDSCDANPSNPIGSQPCFEQGITTVDAWIAFFDTLSTKNYGCSFTENREQFDLSVRARSALAPAYLTTHNEVILSVWPRGIPEQLPLEAIFYLATQTRADGLAGARYIQHDYFCETGRFLPLLNLDLSTTAKQIFTYTPQDQDVQGGTGDNCDTGKKMRQTAVFFGFFSPRPVISDSRQILHSGIK